MFLYIVSLQRMHFIDPLQHSRDILSRKTPQKRETKFNKTRAIFLNNVPFLFEFMPIYVIWQYSLVLPRCSCILFRSKECTSLIRYNTPEIYSVVRHPRKGKLSSTKHAQFSWITSHFYSNSCQLRPSILRKVRISSITNFFVRVRLCSITEFSHTLRRFD